MNYPDGIKRTNVTFGANKNSYSNRGMTLEEDINITNEFYLHRNRAIIHKKPTPVQVVRVNYPKRSAAVITEGYYQRASTTDFNGIYRQKHIDFEAKQTKNKTLFPLANIHEHQVEHMQSIADHGGISFLIIRFTVYNETYLLKLSDFLPFWHHKNNGGRKSIPYHEIQKTGFLIPFQYQARVDYLNIIDKLYFRTEEDDS